MSRSEPRTAQEELMDSLWDLSQVILGPDGQSYIRRYNFFVTQGKGRECPYAGMSLRLCRSEGLYEEVKGYFLRCLEVFRELEGDDFGR